VATVTVEVPAKPLWNMIIHYRSKLKIKLK
jgi:hypothetical protein